MGASSKDVVGVLERARRAFDLLSSFCAELESESAAN
jgi:hypothetical protein